MDWINAILTLISIIATVITIYSTIKSKQYKKDILKKFDYIDYYKFIIGFQDSTGSFIKISKLSDWNRANKGQPYIDKILDVLLVFPSYYYIFEEKDKNIVSEKVSKLKNDLCNLNQKDTNSLNTIRENINIINEITQVYLKNVQNNLSKNTTI